MTRNPVTTRPTVLIVFGARPETIKLAPVITRLREDAPHIRCRVCVTAQHREMLDQVLSLFGVEVHHDLNLMVENQDLFDITAGALGALRRVIDLERPDLMVGSGGYDDDVCGRARRLLPARPNRACRGGTWHLRSESTVSRGSQPAAHRQSCDAAVRPPSSRGAISSQRAFPLPLSL